MTDVSSLPKSGTISIFDAIGNTVMKEAPFTLLNNWLYYNWDGRNHNGRFVGTGTYIAIINVTQNGGKVTSSKKTIGVKR
jgi:flagellar hook assembly protein FlgD